MQRRGPAALERFRQTLTEKTYDVDWLLDALELGATRRDSAVGEPEATPQTNTYQELHNCFYNFFKKCVAEGYNEQETVYCNM